MRLLPSALILMAFTPACTRTDDDSGDTDTALIGESDSDGDGIGDNADNCPDISNADQADADEDGIGDLCNDDRDGDGVANDADAFPDDANESADSDDDGVGDNADVFPDDPSESVDTDSDGVGDNADNCPNISNADQADADEDDIGDVCDDDRDGDGVANDADAFPDDPTESVDADGDGYGANADCNDDDATLYPGAPDAWYDGIDSDCAGNDDYDQDGDGESAFSGDGRDCDDTDASVVVCPGGSSSADAGLSCAQILEDYGTRVSDGVFWLDPTEAGFDAAFQTWCDMTTEGGGWTAIMRAVQGEYVYDDEVWTTNNVDNPEITDLTVVGQSKYNSFNTVLFSEIRSSDLVDFSIGITESVTPASSALEFFGRDGVELLAGSFEPYFNEIMHPSNQQWDCHDYETYGFNQHDYLSNVGLHVAGTSYCDWNGWARWGNRVNANHGFTGNHTGQGWGTHSTIGTDSDKRTISQLLWVR